MLLNLFKKNSVPFELLLILIITIPAIFSLLQPGYFSMHDDQHIVRLFLFDQGIRQGQFYPRWVDGLGFGYGYPLYNFYPPFIYIVGELFHLVGFSFIWSVKMVFILGYLLFAIGTYLFVKKKLGFLAGLVASTLGTYFFYHAVTAYVRGALAEFFAIAILPFIFLSMDNAAERKSIKNSSIFGLCLALLILTHPLIAFPSIFYIGFFFIFYFFRQKNLKDKIHYVISTIFGGILGLALSAFFWLPSLIEKKYTLVDTILTRELANYKLHYIFPSQFYYSPWGYGGSGEGLADGMTFQLGKIHIALVLGAVALFFLLLPRLKNKSAQIGSFLFFTFILLWSLFMTLPMSSFIWDNIQFLSYLQFPWRFLTFVCFFIAVIGSFSIYFLNYVPVLKKMKPFVSVLIILATVFIYHKYFQPQRTFLTNDAERTSNEEIAWRISRTSYEFVPKEVQTKISTIGTTLLNIDHDHIKKSNYEVRAGKSNVQQTEALFHRKSFVVNVKTPTSFQLNTYNFPGWKAYLKPTREKDFTQIDIKDSNALKLITVHLQPGNYDLQFRFEDTPVRSIANIISTLGLVTILVIALFKGDNKYEARSDF